METLGGDPVSTGDLESFSSLFDLPNYDAYTLSKISHLSVRLSEAKTGSFEIASVVKSKVGCVESVTLFTTEGNRILVDSTTGIAAVYIGEDQYLISATDLESERRSLYKAGEAIPRLYTRGEFFTQHASMTNHRQLSATTSSGWATFGLAIGQEILEEFGDPLSELESVYIRGEALGEDERIPFEMLFSEQGVENLVVKLGSDSDYTIHRFQNGSTDISQVATKVDSTWSECFLTSTFEDSNMRDLQDVLFVTMVDGARVVRSTDGTDVAIIHEVEMNPEATKLDAMLPTDEECVNVPSSDSYVPYTYANETNNVDNLTTFGDRRLGSNDWYWSNGISDDYGFNRINFGDHADLSTWAYESWWPSTFSSRCYPDSSERSTYSQNAGLPAGYLPGASNGKKSGGFFEKEVGHCWSESTIRRETRGWLEESVCMVHYNMGGGGLGNIARFISGTRDGDIRARFMYKEGQRRETMTIAFGGTDEKNDWLKFNLQISAKRFSYNSDVSTGSVPDYAYHNGDWNRASNVNLHRGFVDYVEMLEDCVQQKRLELWNNEGIKIASIVGNSLGGAASVLYARKFGNAFFGVTTFGAPLTQSTSDHDVCDSDTNGIFGRRHFQEFDPVATNVLGMLDNYRHELEYAWEWKKIRQCRGKKRWWHWWCSKGYYVKRREGRRKSCHHRRHTSLWDLITKGFDDHYMKHFDGSIQQTMHLGSA